jgi:hypothetical protein
VAAWIKSLIRCGWILVALTCGCKGEAWSSEGPAKQPTEATVTASVAGRPPALTQKALSAMPSASPILSTNTPEATIAPRPSATLAWLGPDSFPGNIDPLTGLEPTNPQHLDRRPILIKVSNYPASLRPQSGLSYADMVWEYFIGIGMTRYLALFYGEDAPRVGPIRSGRLIDPQIVSLYGGFLGMVGADPYVWSVIASELSGRFMSEKPGTCPPICRDPDGISVFADTAAFTEYARHMGLDDQRPDLAGMRFDGVIPGGGQEATKIWILVAYLDQVGWDYDFNRGVYLRSQEVEQSDGSILLEPMVDRLNGEQLAFENVVILFTSHEIIKPSLIEINLRDSDGSRALIFRDGQVYEATFSAVSPVTPLRFFDSQGEPFPFKPGATWFHIVGPGSEFIQLDQGYWKITFHTY